MNFGGHSACPSLVGEKAQKPASRLTKWKKAGSKKD